MTLLLKKRLFSSPAAFPETLREHMRTLGRQRRCRAGVRERGCARSSSGSTRTSTPTTRSTNGPQDALADGRAGRRSAVEGRGSAARAHARAGPRRKRIARTPRPRRCSTGWTQTCRPGGTWNDERVIVFTEYRDTQKWLQDLLVRHGFGAERVALLYGGMDTDERERIKAEFQAPPDRSPVRILLATDAASEGIDLQLHCHRMVHVEIPFSPTRLEQRNGRIDRHGQPSPVVEIHHFVGEGCETREARLARGDLEFLWRIAQKVEQIRDDLGTRGPGAGAAGRGSDARPARGGRRWPGGTGEGEGQPDGAEAGTQSARGDQAAARAARRERRRARHHAGRRRPRRRRSRWSWHVSRD